jgi:NADH-quinone oxidoreductase subunit J
MDQIVFGAFAGIAACAAVGVVAFKNAIRSALCLVMTVFVLGFLYFALSAEAIGITQIAVYAGAIMVLFLFVIMLLNLSMPQVLTEKWDFKKPVGIMLGIGMLGLVLAQVVPAFSQQFAPAQPNAFGQPQSLGRALFTEYVFPFELVSILLLVGVVGAVMLAKRGAK